jgi:hypothetical protein
VKIVRTIAVAAAGLTLAGCGGGGPKYVPVSGVVTLNGKPYGKAVVSFQPLSTPGNPNPGRGSTSYTDANGRFVLKSDDGRNGAVVGKHRVQIQTRRDTMTEFNPETGSPDGGPARPKGEIDPIPLEWYGETSKKEFEVPPEGTDKADFNIVTKRP